jgi:hypothetical protein
MNSRDRKCLQLIIADEIMNKPGYLARVNIKKNYSTNKPFEDICVWFAKSDGTEQEKVIHLSAATLYSTSWHEIAKRITEHLEM